MMTRIVVAAVLLAGLAAGPARAQERIELFTYVNNQVRLVEVDTTVRNFGAVTAVTPLPAEFSSVEDAVVVAGGRYLAWGLPSGLWAFDLRHRAVINATGLLPMLPGGPRLGTNVRVVATDTHQPRLFVSGWAWPNYELWALDLRGGPPVPLGASNFAYQSATYAAGTDELFFLEAAFESGQRVTWIVAVNATTGREHRRWKAPGIAENLRVDPDGRVLWLHHFGLGLEAVDASTGVVLARSDQFSAATTLDAQRGVLFVRQGDFLVAIDPLRLTEIGRARVAFTPPDPIITRRAETLPGRWMTGAYTVRVETRTTLVSTGRTGREDTYEFTCNALTVDALHPDGSRRESADILERLGAGGSARGTRESGLECRAAGVLIRSPFAPTELTAAVVGNHAAFWWSDPGDAADFQLEFGFAPGQRAGALRVGHTARVAIPAVPPGIYYVRVKALNEVGPSPASNEVRVVVP